MREIFVDMETTGESVKGGHRIIELAWVVIMDGTLTEWSHHYYINPERAIDPRASKAHGITDDAVAEAPTFAELSPEILKAMGQSSRLVAHNASFDVSFLNREMKLLGREAIDAKRETVDTLAMAKKLFPNQANDLDSLLKRLNIAVPESEMFGALLDAHLGAKVYLKMKSRMSSKHG